LRAHLIGSREGIEQSSMPVVTSFGEIERGDVAAFDLFRINNIRTTARSVTLAVVRTRSDHLHQFSPHHILVKSPDAMHRAWGP
jgi:hypothetical protein